MKDGIISVSELHKLPDFKPKITSPVYLVVSESEAKNKVSFYLATRLDETINMVKFVGVEIDNLKQAENFSEFLPKKDKSLFKECQIPLSRIYRVQNLIYKHK